VLRDETAVIERAQRGDQAAVMRLYERYQASVFRYIFYRVQGDQHCAEDLTADVFVRMLTKLKTYVQGDQPILAWLYTIAHNLVIDHYRSANSTSHLSLEEDLVAGDVGHPVQATDDRLAQECLAKVLKYLTEEQRQVILLKFVEDRDLVEVAALLGKNERAVRSLQHRALSALHRALTRERCYEP
jgi:RNA polymerase sigma-70 factor (ECF subfamily)